MEVTKSNGADSSGTNPSQSPLISGLPDDISLSCLARVPRKYHAILNCVSKKWRELVYSEEWRLYRRKHNLDETWIYALCRNQNLHLCCYVLDPNEPKLKRKWKRIQDPPPCTLKRKGMGFEALGKNLYLLGGCGWVEDATSEVYCYDAAMNNWSVAPPLSTARCFFASEVLDEKIYAIGGLGSNSSETHSWDTFDPHTNTWKSHFDPNVVLDIEDSIFGNPFPRDNLRHFVKNGKIYIKCGTSVVSSHVYAVVYEPLSGGWHHADVDMMSGWRGPAVVVDGTLYMLDEISGTKLMRWEEERENWEAVGRLSSLIMSPPCHLVAIGKGIFVIGKGLSSVMLDVGCDKIMGGVMVSSSVTKFNHDVDVISCKCVSI